MRRGSRVLGVVAVVVAALALSFLPAAAVAPVAGARYAGRVANAPDIQSAIGFTVSTHGAWVTHLRLGPWPMTLSCGSGGDVPPPQSSSPARIRHGRFTAHVVWTNGADVVARATVTGIFLRHGKEKGVVSSHIVGTSNCDFSRPYTTHTR